MTVASLAMAVMSTTACWYGKWGCLAVFALAPPRAHTSVVAVRDAVLLPLPMDFFLLAACCLQMRDVVIGPGCKLQHSVFSAGVVVGADSVISNSQLGPGVRLEAHSTVDHQQLGAAGFV